MARCQRQRKSQSCSAYVSPMLAVAMLCAGKNGHVIVILTILAFLEIKIITIDFTS